MKIRFTEIPDVRLIEPEIFGDERGYFFDAWRKDRFEEAGISATFLQESQSRSAQWVLRGMHYQIRQPQGKLVRVLEGEVFDVAVDIRRSSPTFGKHVSRVLTARTRHALWIPPGFAHGFLVLSERAEIAYRLTQVYAPEHERRLLWNDPEVCVPWPLPPGVAPVLSPKDAAGLPLKTAECFP